MMAAVIDIEKHILDMFFSAAMKYVHDTLWAYQSGTEPRENVLKVMREASKRLPGEYGADGLLAKLDLEKPLPFEEMRDALRDFCNKAYIEVFQARKYGTGVPEQPAS